MLLDRTGEITDLYQPVFEGPIPIDTPVTVRHELLEEALEQRTSVGVMIKNDTDPVSLAGVFPRLGLIDIDFPSFADGRGFSLARRLRDLGYKGRLRASGPVIADQFAHLLACGFDEVRTTAEIAQRQPAEIWKAQLSKITAGYQRGHATDQSIPDLRQRAATP